MTSSDRKRKGFSLSVPQKIALIFIGIILVGAILLNLPFASQDGKSVGFVNALFTSTSATCVTGLIVVDTATHWTHFGQIVILSLIQIGGLGFMSVATLFILFANHKITLKERMLMGQSISIDDLQGVVKTIKHVLLGTLIIEGIGAILLSIPFIMEFGFLSGLYKGIFHAVSAFCNAGFDVLGADKGAFTGLTSYAYSPIINFTIMGLIVVGGIGFFVWEDILKNKRFKKLMLHSKIVLAMTAGLLIFGAIGFFIFEYNNPSTMGGDDVFARIMKSLFQSVTTRTAGYNTVPQAALTVPSKLLSSALMFIGGSPGSTAGGIKTVTAALLLFTAWSAVKGKSDVTIRKRTIATQTVMKAVAVVIVAVLLVFVGCMVFAIFENVSLVDTLFEVSSAFATVGLSAGATPTLSDISKITLVLLMYFGRVGILTLGTAITMAAVKDKGKIKYPECKIIIG